MMTTSGGGYSRWRDFDITRWRSDSTRDNWGMFLYLREEETHTLWSATHLPVNVKDPRYTAIFTPERVEFRRPQVWYRISPGSHRVAG
jgi:cellobiose phosphorylase